MQTKSLECTNEQILSYTPLLVAKSLVHQKVTCVMSSTAQLLRDVFTHSLSILFYLYIEM